MKQLLFSLFLLLMVGSMTCQAGGKQLKKAVNALASVERNPKAQLKDHQKAVEMLNAVISSEPQDQAEAYLFLGEAYAEFVPVQFRDYAKAGEYYKKALELLSDDDKKLKGRALYNVGDYCYYRQTQTQNLDLALEYFVMASDLFPNLSRAVGEMFEFGVGCDIDPTLALQYYTKAIDNGNKCYAKYYSTMYYVDQITGSLDTEGFNNFRKGILEQRMAKEQPDYNKAKEYLTIAAERDYLPAQFELGTSYMNKIFQGDSPADTRALAEKWLKKAADAGYVPAMHNLGTVLYYSNTELAMEYYEAAAAEGFPPSKEYLEKVAKERAKSVRQGASILGGLLGNRRLAQVIFNDIATTTSKKHEGMTVAQKIKMQKESYNVGQAEVLMSTSVSSDQANQSGDNKIKCRKCDGTGKVTCIICGGTGRTQNGKECLRCHGETTAKCINCDGKGWK